MNKPPKRLRRLQTVFNRSHPIFFLTICTAKRCPLLGDADIQQQFIVFCRASDEKANIWVGRYVLMPDHIHVFVLAEDSAAVSRWVGSLKKYLAVFWKTHGLAAPFWQEGFFDHVLRSNDSYAEKWVYVEQNPVRAQLVNDSKDWPYAGEIHPLMWDAV